MGKEVLLGEESIKKIKKGLDTVADAVKVTLGPKGRNILISKTNGVPLITNDGATIAKEINLKDPQENSGAQVIIKASDETNKEAGDGTTTTAILTQQIFNDGFKAIEEGTDPIDLRNGMNKAMENIIEGLKQESKPIENNEDIKKIATISSGSDLIGDLITEAYDKIGKEGAITIEESKINKTSIEIKQGYKIPAGLVPAYFDIGNRGKSTMDLDNVAILVSASKLDVITPALGGVLNEVAQSGDKILIIAESISDGVMGTLIYNNSRGMPVYGLQLGSMPDRDDILKDVAIVSGAKLFDPEKGISLNNITINDLGMANKVKLKRDTETLLMDYQGDESQKEERIAVIKDELENNPSLTDNEKKRLESRISTLNEGVAVINLGGSSEVELGELKLRVEDALCSVKSSLEEGIVSGAGSAYIRIVKNLEMDEGSEAYRKGQSIVFKAVQSLLKQILQNAQYSEDKIKSVMDEAISTGKVYNLIDEKFEDPEATKVFDPTKVERLALQKAVSTAASLLVTFGMITEEPQTTGDLVLQALGIQN